MTHEILSLEVYDLIYVFLKEGKEIVTNKTVENHKINQNHYTN